MRTLLAVMSLLGASPLGSSVSSFVIVSGGASHSSEVAGRPLDHTLHMFAVPRRAGDVLPAALVAAPVGGFGLPLAKVVEGLKGDPGKPLPGESHRTVLPPNASATLGDPLYVIPTSNDWACFVTTRFTNCDRGLLKEGIAWHVFNTSSKTLVVYGLAADNVAEVDLLYGGEKRRASLTGNVFYVARPITLTSSRKLPPFGALQIHYRSGGAVATVALSG